MATKRDLQQEMQRYRQAERLLQLGRVFRSSST